MHPKFLLSLLVVSFKRGQVCDKLFHFTIQFPPKPEPKQRTKVEPFKLESVARHEQEMLKEKEERMRTEREEAQRRVFRAQPVIAE